MDALLARQFGLIGRRQARQAGLSDRSVDRRLATGEWVRVLPAVFRLASMGTTWQQMPIAAWIWGGEGAVISHRAAARFHGLEGIQHAPGEIYVRNPRRSPSPEVHVHRSVALAPRDLVRIDGLMATSLDRTLIDLGAVVSAQVVEQSLEYSLKCGLTTIPKVRARTSELLVPGRPGPGVLRRILDARDPASAPIESILELKLLRVIRAADLPLPQAQYKLFDGKRFIGRLDFAYPDLGIAIECDGYGFHSGTDSFQRDRDRANWLTSNGWLVLRFTWDDVKKKPRQVANQVARVLEIANRRDQPRPG